MKKTLLFLIIFLMPLCVSTAKNIYTYKLVKPNGEPAEKYVYPNTTNLYGYKIQLTPNPSGSNKGSFEVTLENGKFSDGTSIRKNVPENEIFTVTWNDIANTGNIYGIVKIFKAVAANTTIDTLKAGTPIQFSPPIASLKGQAPTLVVTGSNPPMGSKVQLTAQVLGDVIYPGIMVDNGWGGSTNKIANVFEWSLTNWKTTSGKPGTFITDPDVKQIVVETDYFTQGSIKVRAVNDIGSAYSETSSQNFDRGFSFTNYPSSLIPFGQTSTYTFAVTPVSGVTFEWEVPSGWQINGQGNVLEGVNLNSINVETSSFCSNSSVVRVRLKKDAEVSGWFTCPYKGVSQPIITTSPVYQYENTSLSISNIPASIISSVNWSGEGVVTTSSQGAGAKLVFTKSGLITLTAAVLLNGCSTPIPYKKDVIVGASRLSLSGSSPICTQEIYFVTDLPSENAVSWSATPSGIVSLQPNGSLVTLTKVGSGLITLSATINNSFTITKDIRVGGPSTPTSIGGFASNGLKFASVSQYSFYVQPVDVEGVSQYSWTVRSGSGTILDGQGTPVINFETADVANSLSFYVSVKVGNSCGWSSTFTRSGTIDGGIGHQAPKSKESFDESVQAIEEVGDQTNYNVLICDQLGRVVLQTTQKGADFSTSTSKIANGTYIVKLYNDKTSMQKKVIVNHLR